MIYGSILTREVTPPDALVATPRGLAELLRRRRTVSRPSCPPNGEAAKSRPQALIAAGHRRIAFISGEPWMEASDQRMEGYERALRAARIPVDPSLIVEGNFLPTADVHATLRLMQSGPASRCHFLRQRSDGRRLLRGAQGTRRESSAKRSP